MLQQEQCLDLCLGQCLERLHREVLLQEQCLEWDLTELRKVERLEALPLVEQCLEWDLTELRKVERLEALPLVEQCLECLDLMLECLEWVTQLQDLCLEWDLAQWELLLEL